MNDSIDSDNQNNNQSESIEESTYKRNKNVREASKKAQKLIDHYANDEGINEDLISSNDKKQSQKIILPYQASFIAPANYRSSFSSINRNKKGESYLNFINFCNKITQKNNKEGVSIDQSAEMMEFINIGLKTYLKNSLEKLIQINRKRTSYVFPQVAYHKKIAIESFNSNSEVTNTKPFQRKIEFVPYKKFNIFYTRNVNRNIQYIERYKRLLGKDKDKDNNNNNNNTTELKQNEDREHKKDNHNEIQELDCCIFNDYDITRNIKLKYNKKRVIELKDLIRFLEEENKTPLQRVLLHKSYIIMTMQKS